jgi:hypothetical protein
MTDASGSVVFPALLPTTASLPAYLLNATATGYVTMREDAPPANTAQTSIAGGQTFQTVLRVYKPSTITIVALNANGTPYSGTATATVGSSRGTQSFSFTGGTLNVPSIAGEPVVPNIQYTARILASNGMYSAATTQLVPNQYPIDNTKTFNLTLGGSAATMVTLTVRAVNAAGNRVAGANVTVSGGPGSGVLLSGTTNSSGDAVFSVPSNSTPGYTWTATSGALTGTASGAVTSTVTRTVTVR